MVFHPVFAILRAILSWVRRFGGVIGMGAAVVLIALLPWLDRGEVKSVRYRGPIFKTAFSVVYHFVHRFGYFGCNGGQPMPARWLRVSFRLSISPSSWGMPFYTKLDKNPTGSRTRNHEYDQTKIMFCLHRHYSGRRITCLQHTSDEGSENETHSEKLGCCLYCWQLR